MSEICDWNELVERKGLYYKKFSDVPFTGKVTGKGQGELKDGKKEGPWVGFNEDGTIVPSLTGTYKNGKKVK